MEFEHRGIKSKPIHRMMGTFPISCRILGGKGGNHILLCTAQERTYPHWPLLPEEKRHGYLFTMRSVASLAIDFS